MTHAARDNQTSVIFSIGHFMIDRHFSHWVVVVAMLGLSACGGGSSASNPSDPNPPNTASNQEQSAASQPSSDAASSAAPAAVTAPALKVTPQSNYIGTDGKIDTKKINAVQQNYLSNLGATK